MPICNMIVADELGLTLSDEQLVAVRKAVAAGLDSSARRLDHTHIVLRVLSGRRAHMLGEVELEVVGQFYLRRFLSRDKRAESISQDVSAVIGVDVATWILLLGMGYARVTASGERYFSD
jgi:hypothetical protein